MCPIPKVGWRYFTRSLVRDVARTAARHRPAHAGHAATEPVIRVAHEREEAGSAAPRAQGKFRPKAGESRQRTLRRRAARQRSDEPARNAEAAARAATGDELAGPRF